MRQHPCTPFLFHRGRGPSIVSLQNALTDLFLQLVEGAAGAGKHFVNYKHAKLFVTVLHSVPVRHDNGPYGLVIACRDALKLCGR